MSKSTEPPLVERESELAQLSGAFERACEGPHGLCAVIAGGAGLGKTALAQAFLGRLPPATRVLACGCEALFTPRPLGPLRDIASQLPDPVRQALQAGTQLGAVLPDLLHHFQCSRAPTVLLMEDLHWADTGTLDVVAYLGRRLRGVRLMMVLTHRAPAGTDDALPIVLGQLPAAAVLRLALAPLSRPAVQALAAARQRDGSALFAITGGVPFYVAEMLSHEGGLPPSVRDAVLAELARLEPAAAGLVRWLSLFPGRARRDRVARLVQPPAAAVEAALRSGLVVADASSLAFRHEIARIAVYESWAAPQRADAHAAIQAALAEPGGDGAGVIAERVHHAMAAARHADVAALAPRAAAQAAAAGSHSEAARLYRAALEADPAMADTGATRDAAAQASRAALLEAMADELMTVGRHGEAIEAREQALRLHRAAGDLLREGAALRALARLHWLAHGARGEQTAELARQAVERLERLPPGPELAMAYSTCAHLHLAREDSQGALFWGLRAVELAEQIDDKEALAHALNNVASARLRGHDDPLAWDRMRRSLALGLAHGPVAEAARAYNNLVILQIVHHHFAGALGDAAAGIAYAEAHGLEIFSVRMRIRRAFAHLVMGRWDLAAADLQELRERHSPSPMERATLDLVAGLLALRRGQDPTHRAIAEAVASIIRQRVDIWFISPAAVLAEAAWLAADPAALERAARPGLAHMVRIGDRWRSGELATWLHRAQLPVQLAELPPLSRPHSLELQGRWREAAEEWQRLGCPYNQALALVQGDDAAAAQALGIFEQLGATPAAQRVRALLRGRGVRVAPRGPRERTRSDPLGLTAREREVFELLRQGHSNAAIARRLHRSERTVEHHAAALLHKLGLSSRVELLARYPRAAAGGAEPG